jgi:aspartyl aminopeptidase
MSSLVAFAVGEKYSPGSGFKIIGAHTDSPNFRIKPNSDRERTTPEQQLQQVNVSCYGSGLWHTWFDRDLSVSGRLMIRSPEGKIRIQLVRVPYPILRIPNLSIHLTPADERDAFKFNKETHLAPLLCATASQSLSESQPTGILDILAKEAQCEPTEILSFDLSLFDTQKGTLSGPGEDYIFSSRLDNLASCYVALEALCDSTTIPSLSTDRDISMIVLFDHEEVGSGSLVGASSSLLPQAMNRILLSLPSSTSSSSAPCSPEDILAISRANSFMFSLDMAHGLHPNYSARHEASHRPLLNGGLVLKENPNQRYSSLLP